MDEILKCSDDTCPVETFDPRKMYGLLVDWCPYCGNKGERIDDK